MLARTHAHTRALRPDLLASVNRSLSNLLPALHLPVPSSGSPGGAGLEPKDFCLGGLIPAAAAENVGGSRGGWGGGRWLSLPEDLLGTGPELGALHPSCHFILTRWPGRG